MLYSFITFSFHSIQICNLTPVYCAGVLSFRRVTIFTILMLNFLYLSVIWGPFTITTFKHNLQEHKPVGVERVQASSSPDMMGYLRRHNVEPQEARLSRGREESLQFDQGYFFLKEVIVEAPQPKTSQSDLEESLNGWITLVQDLITSSFTYSLLLMVVVEKIMVKKVCQE